MELELTDEHKLVQKTAADFAKNEVLPKAAEIDRNHRHPTELVQRMAELSGYSVPEDIVRRVTAGGDDHEEIRKRGIDLATELCADLLEAQVAGLHFYTLNFSRATREVYSKLGLTPD